MLFNKELLEFGLPGPRSSLRRKVARRAARQRGWFGAANIQS
jgi:hypothetical protein